MAVTVKQGVEYEISAKNKSEPVVREAVRVVVEGNKEVEESAAKAGRAAGEAFSPLKTITAALSGNLTNLAQQVAALADRLKLVSVSFAPLTGVAAVVTAIGAAWSYAAETIDKVRDSLRDVHREEVDDQIRAMTDAQESIITYAEAAIEGIKSEADETDRLVEHTKNLAKAELEVARARELAAAKKEDRDAISREYDKEAMALEQTARRKRLENRLAEAEKLEQERDIQKDQLGYKKKDAEAEIRKIDNAVEKMIKEAYAQTPEMRGSKFGLAWTRTEEDRLTEATDKVKASDAYKQLEEDRAKWEKTLEGLEKSVAAFDKKVAAAEKAVEKAKQALEADDAVVAQEDAQSDLADKLLEEKKDDESRKRQEEESREQQRAYEEELRLCRAEEAERQRLYREQVAEEQRLDREASAERRRLFRAEMEDSRQTLQAERAVAVEDRADAVSRLGAAQQQSDRAWSWYRNQDSLAAQLQEERDNAEAETRYQKAFERLKGMRKDWRTAEDYGSGSLRALSLEETAVKRVALAREEERAAERELQGVNERLDTLNGMIADLVGMAEE